MVINSGDPQVHVLHNYNIPQDRYDTYILFTYLNKCDELTQLYVN